MWPIHRETTRRELPRPRSFAAYPALIVMPEDTPEIKKANTKSYGAEVVTYDRATESREEIANHYVAKRGAVLVPPFEHADIIAGQGTSGLEIITALQDRRRCA